VTDVNSLTSNATRPPTLTRRTMLRSGAVLAGGSLALGRTAVRPAAAVGQDDWPIQRFDPGNTAYDPDGTALESDATVRTAMAAPAGFSNDYLLADGTAYVYDADEGSVIAVDLVTGDSLWTSEVADQQVVPELVEGDLLVCRALGGPTYVLDRDTGEVTAELSTPRGFHLGYAGGGEWFAPTVDGRVIAGRENAEEFLWTAEIEGVGFRPAVDDERLYVATVAGVAPEDLNIETPNEMDASGRLYAIDRSDGSVVWAVTHDGVGVRPVAVADGQVYWPRADGTLAAYDAETGDEQWTFTGQDGFNAAVAVTENAVLAGNDDGRLYGIARESGEQFAAAGIGERVRGAPVVVGRTVFFGTDNSMVFSAFLDDGETLWEFETDAPVRSLTAGDEHVVVGSTERCYVIGPSGGVSAGRGTEDGGGSGTGESGDGEEGGSGNSEESDGGTHRGFLTNDPDSELSFLDDPVTLTWAGIAVSIVGIVMQLIGEQT